MKPRLTRSTADKMVAGVCGGLGEYLAIDPVLIRIFFVLLTIGGGSGVLVYLLLWILIPEAGRAEAGAEETIRSGANEIGQRARAFGEELRGGMRGRSPQTVLIVGVGLVLLGLVFLAQNLRIVWLRWLDFDILWPLLLIVGGAALIWRRAKGASA